MVGVQAAAVAVAALAGGPVVVEALLGDALGLRRVDARAAERGVEQAADRQGRIADLFRGEPQARLLGQEPVLGVLRQEFRPGRGGLPVRGRGHDQPMYRFHAPTALAERRRQPVE